MNRRNFFSSVAALCVAPLAGKAVVAKPILRCAWRERIVLDGVIGDPKLWFASPFDDVPIYFFGGDHQLWAYRAGNLERLGDATIPS